MPKHKTAKIKTETPFPLFLCVSKVFLNMTGLCVIPAVTGTQKNHPFTRFHPHKFTLLSV
jgi:hypothetical protein